MLNLGLESRRNRFGAAIVKAVLLLHSVVACVWMCPIEDFVPPKRPLLGLLVWAIAVTRRYRSPVVAGGLRIAPEVVRLCFLLRSRWSARH